MPPQHCGNGGALDAPRFVFPSKGATHYVPWDPTTIPCSRPMMGLAGGGGEQTPARLAGNLLAHATTSTHVTVLCPFACAFKCLGHANKLFHLGRCAASSLVNVGNEPHLRLGDGNVAQMPALSLCEVRITLGWRSCCSSASFFAASGITDNVTDCRNLSELSEIFPP